MRTASPDLVSLLNGSSQFLFADLLTIEPVVGNPIYLTNADLPITYGGITYQPYPFERGSTKLIVGVEVDSLDITLFANGSTLLNGVPVPKLCNLGGFDGALVSLDRAFMSDWGSAPVGTLSMFRGHVSDAAPSRTSVQLTIKSFLDLLNIKMPKNLYQAGCVHTLFDAGCSLAKESHAVTGVATTGSTKSAVNSSITAAAGFFDNGTISIISGVNANLRRTVKSFNAGVFTLILPLPAPLNAGDSIIAYPGCDKQQSTCNNKFSNVVNFRGFPFIPVPESAL